jgi:protein gp37
MHPHWVRSLHDQCLAAAVPFFFKQWGQYAPIAEILRDSNANEDVLADASFNKTVAIHIDGTVGWQTEDDPAWSNLKPYAMERVGKKSAGRLLDGREWSEYPA